jgi:hypothetical protein
VGPKCTIAISLRNPRLRALCYQVFVTIASSILGEARLKELKLNLPTISTIRDLRAELSALNSAVVSTEIAEALAADPDAVIAVQTDASPAGNGKQMAVAPIKLNRGAETGSSVLMTGAYELHDVTGEGEATAMLDSYDMVRRKGLALREFIAKSCDADLDGLPSVDEFSKIRAAMFAHAVMATDGAATAIKSEKITEEMVAADTRKAYDEAKGDGAFAKLKPQEQQKLTLMWGTTCFRHMFNTTAAAVRSPSTSSRSTAPSWTPPTRRTPCCA